MSEEKRPESPGDFYKKHKRAIESRKAKLKFESDGMRRDYERAVASNPENIYGLPPFFPAIQIKMFYPQVFNDEYYDTENIIKSAYYNSVAEFEMYCDVCDKITIISITPSQSFCKKCGKKYNYKLKTTIN